MIENIVKTRILNGALQYLTFNGVWKHLLTLDELEGIRSASNVSGDNALATTSQITSLQDALTALTGRVTSIENSSGKQTDTIALTGTGGTATIAGAGGLTKVISFNSDLSTTASDFVTANAADYLAQDIVLTSDSNDLIFTAKYFGQEFTSPTITTIVSDMDGSVANTQANVEAAAQVDTVTLTGASGTANIEAAGGLTKLVTFAEAGTTDLTQTAADFVTSWEADYAAEGITITSSGADIIFTSDTAGTGFISPTITNVTGDLDGTVANTQVNVEAVAQIDTITVTGSQGQATIAAAGGLTKVLEFDTDLSTTNENFVSAYAADYAAEGITLTSSTDDLVFTSDTAGVAFTSPTITTLVADLDGTVSSEVA